MDFPKKKSLIFLSSHIKKLFRKGSFFRKNPMKWDFLPVFREERDGFFKKECRQRDLLVGSLEGNEKGAGFVLVRLTNERIPLLVGHLGLEPRTFRL